MKNGIELIAQERAEQIEKHSRTIEEDVNTNSDKQLSKAASILCYDQENCLQPEDIESEHCPFGWDISIWSKMVGKSYRERLIIAGALIAAEIDRLDYKS